ncbi:MAG: sulfatase-like hydrolase/transferase [Bryobacteraceae bacterium]
MHRRAFLGTLAGLPTLAQSRLPNIILILCDDLGYGDLGCYGNRIIQTPNLDRLASRGVRFTQFYTTSPVCSPTRAAIMTGHYPQRYGIHYADLPERLPRYPLPSSALTIAEVLHDAGYFTAHVGKWHLGEPPDAAIPRHQGFDQFAGSFGGRPSSPWNQYARSINPEVIFNEDRPTMQFGHVTDLQTAMALDVIEQQTTEGRPFFLNLWYNAPHEPLAPLAHQSKLYGDWSPEEQTYFQTVTDLDFGIGRILAMLREKKIEDNTLVFVTSDNGPEAHKSKYSRGSAGPLRGMKTQLWDGGVRVPAIAAWPGVIPPGSVNPYVASVLDLFPTFSAPGGIHRRDWTSDGGVNLLPILQRQAVMPERALVFESHFPQRGAAPSLPMAVRLGRWKLFSDYAFERKQLFDMESDPGESNDIAPQNPRLVAWLLVHLKRWYADFGPKLDLDRKTTPVATPAPAELEKRYYRN